MNDLLDFPEKPMKDGFKKIIGDEVTDEISVLAKVVDHNPIGILITNNKAKIVYINSSLLDHSGYSKDELIGYNPRIFNSGYQDKAFYQDLWSTILNGQVWRGTFNNRRKDGSSFWEKAVIAPILDEHENVTHFIGMKEDITEQVTAENELKAYKDRLEKKVEERSRELFENEKRLRVAMENAGEGVWEWNFRTDELFINPEWVAKIGFLVDNMDGKGSDWEKIIHPDNMAAFDAARQHIVKGVKTKFVVEHQLRNSGDKKRWMRINGAAIEYDRDGNPEKITGTHQDITERKKVYDDLKVAKERAEISNKLKASFLSNITHEIKTPMNGIMGFVSMLEKHEGFDEQEKEYLGIIKESSNQLNHVIDDIIYVSQLESGDHDFNETYFGLHELMKEVFNVHQEAAADKGLELRMQLFSDKELKVKTDKAKLKHILFSLVNNGIKFTRSGYVEIGYFFSKPGSSEMVFYVKDTGIGIARQDHQVIFEYFRQVDHRLARDYDGTGIGLSIVRANVNTLGGKIWLNSTEGSGTTFYFTIPGIRDL